MNVYFISGLGADRRAFSHIQLSANHQAYYIDWLEPEPNESLVAYAARMALQINTQQPFVLVGLSFGGIVAIEIAKQTGNPQVIIVSSISHRNQLPIKYRFLGVLGLHRTPLLYLIKQGNAWVHHLFGVRSKRLKTYLDEMIQQTSLGYLRWSLRSILQWQQTEKPTFVYHIHGDADKIFPLNDEGPDKIIPRAGHFMIITHAKWISDIINEILDKSKSLD
jgi:pimeloyl-ACP methyl ester carboxylesterase